MAIINPVVKLTQLVPSDLNRLTCIDSLDSNSRWFCVSEISLAIHRDILANCVANKLAKELTTWRIPIHILKNAYVPNTNSHFNVVFSTRIC